MGASGFRQFFPRFLLGLLLAGSLLFSVRPVSAANGVVGTGSAGSCTEQAFDSVLNTVQSSGGGVITFNCGAAPHTLILSAHKSISANVELDGGGLISISGGNSTSLFQVFSGQTFTLRRISLTRASGPYGAVENFGSLVAVDSQLTFNTASNTGGAVNNYGSLSLTNTVLANNSAQLGGAVYVEGGASAEVSNSQFNSNTAVDGGGAIALISGATVTVTNSQFSGNKGTNTFAQGGAVQSAGSLTASLVTFHQNNSSRGGALSVLGGVTSIAESTFTGNYGAYGGGIRQEGGELNLNKVTLSGNGYAPNGSKVNTGGGALSWGTGTANLTQVTISGNWASYGGGFDHENGTTNLTNVSIHGNSAVGAGGFDQNGGTVALTNVTISGNSAGFFGGGIGNRAGTLTIKNTVVSGNTNTNNQQSWNCNKTAAGATFSLSSDFTCGFGAGKDNVNVLLGPLANNGGATQTMLPQQGSPLIDAGTGAGCPVTDQRGVSRPQGQACDVGAVEVTAAEQDPMKRVFVPLTLR